MEAESEGAGSQNQHLAAVRLIHTLSFLWGCNGDRWCIHWCRSWSLSSKDTVDKYRYFFGQMKCGNNVKKCPNSSLGTDIIASWLVDRKRPASIYFLQKGVLLLSENFTSPAFSLLKGFKHSPILNISWIAKWVPLLPSARHGNCGAPSEPFPMPIVWRMVVIFCEVHTIQEPCSLLW